MSHIMKDKVTTPKPADAENPHDPGRLGRRLHNPLQDAGRCGRVLTMDVHAARREHSGRTRALLGCTTAIVLLAGGLTVFAASGPTALTTSPASATSAPSSPPVAVCGNASLLTGPSSAPPGAVTVPAGDNAAFFDSSRRRRRPTGSHRARTRSVPGSTPRSTPATTTRSSADRVRSSTARTRTTSPSPARAPTSPSST